ncbi:malate synthase-like [Schistocerca gregaria]|uniref:malate synthase-like n=1 Tax=Schistocerca gregaria TaxID=7010 RepID=UPI00211E0035|nr:malate synthase-like [Schistocerca gregaria]
MAADAATVRRLRVLSRVIAGVRKNNASAKPLWNVEVEAAPPGAEEAHRILLTTAALSFVADLTRTFEHGIEELYRRRAQSKCEFADGRRLPAFRHGENRAASADWRVAPVPGRLTNRHVDLGDVSPADIDHFRAALKADVQGIQVDFDDGHCPTWGNQLTGLLAVYRAVHGTLEGTPPIAECPVLMLRPRAWNMSERNLLVDGKEVPGAVFDFALLMFHCGHILAANQSGPFFYLSKVEGAFEARLWNEIFVWAQDALRIPRGTIKACVLIENILSSFEMEEILYELREHSLGLNCGIWDYAASIIAKFGDRKEFVLPDRNKYVNMEKHFLVSYMRLVVQTCHRRGAHATGGMAAFVVEGDDSKEKLVVDKVCQAKLQEIQHGVDGFMVYDLRLVPYVNQLWERAAADVNQLSVIHHVLVVSREDLLQMPAGGVTEEGLRHNIAVAVLFVFHWFKGRGHFFYRGCVEDSATAEISRSQVWQWIRHQVCMEKTNIMVTKHLVKQLTTDFVQQHQLCKADVAKMRAAAEVFMDIVTRREFPDFITTYLNQCPLFWHFQRV